MARTRLDALVTDELLESDMDSKAVTKAAPPVGATCGAAGGVTRAGSPCRCRLNLSPASGLCVQHDPERVEAAQALRVAGGAASGKRAQAEKAALPEGMPGTPKTLDDAARLAAWISNAILTQQIDARTGEAATKAVRQFQLCEKERGLERKVKDLEAKLKTALRGAAR